MRAYNLHDALPTGFSSTLPNYQQLLVAPYRKLESSGPKSSALFTEQDTLST